MLASSWCGTGSRTLFEALLTYCVDRYVKQWLPDDQLSSPPVQLLIVADSLAAALVLSTAQVWHILRLSRHER